MKIDKLILQERDKLNVVAETPDRKHKILGSTVRFNGHTMYEINCSTGQITEAVYKKEKVEIVPIYDINFGGQIGTTTKTVKDIETKENCLYISCLNKKIAKKKFLKWIIEKRQQQKK